MLPCRALLFHNKIHVIHHFFKCCCSTGIQLLQLQPIVNNHGVRPHMIQEGLPYILIIAGNDFWKLVQAFTRTIIAYQSLYLSLSSLYYTRYYQVFTLLTYSSNLFSSVHSPKNNTTITT